MALVLNDEDEVDDETIAQLVMLMGVMLGVGGAANAVPICRNYGATWDCQAS